jgi:hypothetical protein
VLALSMREAVPSAGGWVFDQTMVGWDAVLLTADFTNARAATILGARACSLEAALADAAPSAGLGAVAVHAELYRRDPRVRRMVLDLLRAGQGEVRFWGVPRPAEIDGLAQERHLLSSAAQAFKTEAIAALPAPAPVAGRDPIALTQAAETFHRARLRGRNLVTA